MNEKAVRPAPSREETLDEVLKLAKLGLRLHPVAARDKVPILSSWPTRATTDERTIRLWASQYDNCNFGVATGEASGVLVLDVDPKHGGNDSLELLKAEHGLPETWLAKTGSGGFHYYFAYPKGKEIRNSSNKIGRGLDIRATNGQVLVPPSIHPNGTPYEWINHPSTTKLAEAPTWLLKMILEDEGAKYSPLGGKLEVGSRNNQIYHQALALARQGAEKDFIVAVIEKWVEDQRQDIPLAEIEKTVGSACEAAKAKPIELEDRSDMMNAELLIREHGENLIYVHGIGWHVWNGKCWKPDLDDTEVTQLYTATMRKLQEEAAARMATARSKAQMAEAARLGKWAVDSLNAYKISAAISLAAKLPGVRKMADEIDSTATQWLLNVRNGTLDLKTGELRPHQKSDYITKLIDVDYDPEAKAPFWESTLKLIFGDNQRLIDYMRRALGYTLTGTQDERCFFVAWGESGANGKSTLLETVQDLLTVGYAQMSDMTVITSDPTSNRVAASLAKLQGARFVNMNEAEENQKLSEALIKQLTGGDTIEACYKYKNPFTYRPVFKLWIRTNEKPVIHSQNNAIWDRVKLIPFDRSIPPDKRLPRSEVDARLRAEYPGILAWMVRGCQEWQKGGLQDPPEVTAAVQGYRVESDVVKAFYEECLIPKGGAVLKIQTVYQAYVWWSRDAGEKRVMTRNQFTRRLRRIASDYMGHSGGTVLKDHTLTPEAMAYGI